MVPSFTEDTSRRITRLTFMPGYVFLKVSMRSSGIVCLRCSILSSSNLSPAALSFTPNEVMCACMLCAALRTYSHACIMSNYSCIHCVALHTHSLGGEREDNSEMLNSWVYEKVWVFLQLPACDRSERRENLSLPSCPPTPRRIIKRRKHVEKQVRASHSSHLNYLAGKCNVNFIN
jgi:hypothetical protein